LTVAPTTRTSRTARTRAELDALASDSVVTAVADTRDAEALANAVAAAEARWGGLDAAIAVAGVIAGGVPAWELPLEQERAVLDIDLGGVLTLARVAVPALLRALRRGADGSSRSRRPRPPGAADARRVLRREGRRHRLRPSAGRRAARHRHHRQRRQPRLDVHSHPG